MPIFEYICRDCQHRFETFVTSERQPECPECHSRGLEKQWSVFAAVSGAKSAPRQASPGPCGTCGDPRGPGACNLN
jgi:putative FmdB family regulatory protein